MSSVEPNCRIVGVIPARYDSERLPGKVLRPIAGRAMVHRVYERTRVCPLLSELWVAADSESVRAYCEQHGIPVLMTDRRHRSGTERILEVMEKVRADVYVNVQADEPMVSPNHVQLLIEPFLKEPRIQVTTLKIPLSPAAAQDPNVVKVVTGRHGEALYFSRAPIPHSRDSTASPMFYKHLGLYAYRRESLEQYRTFPPAPLEQAERLEQLRFLENGIPIQVVETAEDTIGVDTEEDWRAVQQFFEGRATDR